MIGLDPPKDEDQTEAVPAQPNPKVGSFERFMSTFGNPGAWSGRG